MLISILKLSKTGAVKQEDVKSDANIPSSLSSLLLGKLQHEGLVYLKEGIIEASAESRVKLAVKAVQMGADVERVSDFLEWREFETICSLALELNGYITAKNVRFKHEGKRWEIDIVGCKKPLVICVDCKQWHHGLHPSTLNKIAEAQTARVKAFVDTLPIKTLNLPCTKWGSAVFVPVILSLISVSFKFYDGVPVVPILQFQDFLQQLPLNLDSVKVFRKKFEHL